MSRADPLRVDRELAATATAWRRWRRAVREGARLDEDPFVRAVHLTGRTLFQELLELPAEDPLRRPLLRWVYRLAEQRINRLCAVHLEFSRRVATHPVDHPHAGQLTTSAMLGAALRDAPRRAAWLRAMLDRDSTVTETTALLWERRQEIAVRMGLASPDEIELPGPGVVAGATAWLEQTDDAAQELGRHELGDLVGLALGADAAAGWPARLSPRSLQALLGDGDLLRGLDLDPGRLPSALAASSFLRALARVGAAWVDATAPRDQPFVVAHDPYGLSRRTHGALLALLPLEPEFARRRLGLGREQLADHQRVIRRVVLIESRSAAMRLLLRGPALRGRAALGEAYRELVERTFGVALREAHPGGLWRLHVDDAQRFGGWVLAASLRDRLRREHNEDWFRNPRAIDQLRSEAALSPVSEVEPAEFEAGTAALARRLFGD